MVHRDAAWGHAPEFRSKASYVVFVVSDDIEKRAQWLSPIVWSNHRQKRVANSTLTVEAMACVESIDE